MQRLISFITQVCGKIKYEKVRDKKQSAHTTAVESLPCSIPKNVRVADFFHPGDFAKSPKPWADRAIRQRLRRYPSTIDSLMGLSEDMKVKNVFFPRDTSLHQTIDHSQSKQRFRPDEVLRCKRSIAERQSQKVRVRREHQTRIMSNLWYGKSVAKSFISHILRRPVHT